VKHNLISVSDPLLAATTTQTASWSNPLCFIGDCGTCLYSWLLPGCAMASARTNYDGSSCCFNLCCGTPQMLHNIVREGYGIEGSCLGDVCLMMWCAPCAVNRAAQEVKMRGPVRQVMAK
jgi:hypothetical protein